MVMTITFLPEISQGHLQEIIVPNLFTFKTAFMFICFIDKLKMAGTHVLLKTAPIPWLANFTLLLTSLQYIKTLNKLFWLFSFK